jgi:hypothetical protein
VLLVVRGRFHWGPSGLPTVAEAGIAPAQAQAQALGCGQAGLRVRHGINGRPHCLSAFGGPSAFTPDVWSVFTHPGAEQRIRRLLTSQVRQLETAVGTALLRTGPDGQLTLTAYGQLFAGDVTPVLKMLEPTHGGSH